MMDAVTGLKHHRLAMSGSGERKSRGASVGSTTAVKTEPQDEDAWKTLPTASEAAARVRAASPLQSKGGSVDDMPVDPVASLRADRNGGGGDIVPTEARPNPPAARQRVRSSSTTTQDKEKINKNGALDDLDDAARKLHELDLYDFKDSSSSPADQQQQQQSHIPSVVKTSTAAAPARSHRRHSSIPKETMKSSAGSAGPVASVAASETERTKPPSSTTTASSACGRPRPPSRGAGAATSTRSSTTARAPGLASASGPTP